MTSEENTGLAVPERVIPTPTTVSPEAQAFLARGLPIKPVKIPYTDKDAWRAYQAESDKHLLKLSEMRYQPYAAKITSHALGEATLYEIEPDTLDPAHADKAILHMHGGGFFGGGGPPAAHVAKVSASLTGLRSFSVDYRRPPDHPYPTPLDDCLAAYRWVLARFKPAKIALEGGSAGANLVAAAILRSRDEGLPLPGACAMHTAAVDLTQSGDSFATNAVIDIVLQGPQEDIMLLYSGEHDRRNPYLSPLFGDFAKGFPPSILTTGTRDLLLSSTVSMHRKLRQAGIEAELHVFEAMPHGGLSGMAPEDRELQREIADFIKRKLGVG